MRPHTVDIFGVHASTGIKYSIHLDKFDHDLTSRRHWIDGSCKWNHPQNGLYLRLLNYFTSHYADDSIH